MIWLALSTFLVLIMQAGFACFEAGLVRNKNSINVAIKNVADLGTSVVLFMLIGYPLMFGPSDGVFSGWVGWETSPLTSDDPLVMLNALFQAMFAGTAVTIVSGAMAERARFWAYLTLAIIVAVVIYPVSGHQAMPPAAGGKSTQGPLTDQVGQENVLNPLIKEAPVSSAGLCHCPASQPSNAPEQIPAQGSNP